MDSIQVVAAVAVWMAMHFLSPLFLKIVLGAVGRSVTGRVAYTLRACPRVPARWHLAYGGRVADLSEMGIPPVASTEFVLLENLSLGQSPSSSGVRSALIVGGEKWRLRTGWWPRRI